MLQLVLALAVAQADVPAAEPGDETQAQDQAREQPAPPEQPQPKWMPREEESHPAEAPPAVSAASQPSLLNRTLYSGLGGIGGSAVGLGVSMLLMGCPSQPKCYSPSIDITFANAVLSALLLTGVTFTIHETTGGHGEITLALLGSLAVMGGSAVAARAIDGTMPTTPILTTAIGTLPAVALSVLILELTSPHRSTRPQVQVGVLPGGGYLGVTQSF